MKKKGFTLAEVLITLAVIGVIAAITLPSLMTDTTSAQIGPKLAKAVAMFEQANETMLNAHSVDSLSDAGLSTNAETYANELGNYLKGHVVTETVEKEVEGKKEKDTKIKFSTKDGMLFTFNFLANVPHEAVRLSAPHLQQMGNVTIDINGDLRPNADGTDVFYFTLWNDGSLRPKGGVCWEEPATNKDNDEASKQLWGACEPSSVDGAVGHWKQTCPRAEDGNVSNYAYCAGHIFENNFKVLYR